MDFWSYREEGAKFRHQLKPDSAATLLWSLAKLPQSVRSQVDRDSGSRSGMGVSSLSTERKRFKGRLYISSGEAVHLISNQRVT